MEPVTLGLGRPCLVGRRLRCRRVGVGLVLRRGVGRLQAATIAALAGSPIAAAGFAQAAAGSKGSNPWEVKHAPMGASPPGQHNAQQAAAAAAANPFAAMMAMGAMKAMRRSRPRWR